LQKEQEELERMRRFKAMPLPDYERLKMEILPSDKPLTQPHRPVFYADLLPPKKEKSKDFGSRDSMSPQGFKF
jgi:hypothetical protein